MSEGGREVKSDPWLRPGVSCFKELIRMLDE